MKSIDINEMNFIMIFVYMVASQVFCTYIKGERWNILSLVLLFDFIIAIPFAILLRIAH